jgi:hypothetical protein
VAERPLLKDQAYDGIKERFVSGAAPPGTSLSERNLAREMAPYRSIIPPGVATSRSSSSASRTSWSP